MQRWSLGLLLLIAAGCAGPPAQPPQPAVNLTGYPPDFRQGHSDGCGSARPNATRVRDEKRYKSEGNYAQGWDDGYDYCRRKFQAQ